MRSNTSHSAAIAKLAMFVVMRTGRANSGQFLTGDERERFFE